MRLHIKKKKAFEKGDWTCRALFREDASSEYIPSSFFRFVPQLDSQYVLFLQVILSDLNLISTVTCKNNREVNLD